MKGHIKILAWLLPAFFAVSVTAEPSRKTDSASNAKIDPKSGLKIAPGWETVKANCTACHSAKFIIAQQGDRKTWLEIIRWMQRTQGLWPLDPKTENTILTYLATQYPPVQGGRRPNLPAGALPPNPWKQR